MRNIKLTIEYDGTAYHGWQIQPGLKTIQGVIRERISQITQEKINLLGAGRTDAGVHALGQVANFHTESTIDLIALQRGLNSLLAPDIVIKGVDEVEEGFHARFSARSKVYEYHILNQPYPSAIGRNYAWFIPHEIDLTSMQKCGRLLIGSHDFSSFRASGDESRHSIREVIRLEIEQRGGHLIVVAIEANAFLREMVRSIVGTLVAVGRGKTSVEEFEEIFQARDRRKAGMTAPAHGLFLAEVKY
ncbi:MAG: tRNA pseudouridine(38-40) synthase TruA [Deltaproteobacteria bacterium RBG_13_52_11]|nr:MAG: tRNA pseudouridine(38-40) synthase TruA [Deltaproteobacteria bacterium RBG_13_52_11]